MDFIKDRRKSSEKSTKIPYFQQKYLILFFKMVFIYTIKTDDTVSFVDLSNVFYFNKTKLLIGILIM